MIVVFISLPFAALIVSHSHIYINSASAATANQGEMANFPTIENNPINF